MIDKSEILPEFKNTIRETDSNKITKISNLTYKLVDMISDDKLKNHLFDSLNDVESTDYNQVNLNDALIILGLFREFDENNDIINQPDYKCVNDYTMAYNYYNNLSSDDSDVDEYKTCPSCGSDNPVSSKFCLECGVQFTQDDNKSSITCPYCNSSNPASSNFCLECGKSLTENKSSDESSNICPKCGSPNSKNNKFCLECGNVLRQENTNNFEYVPPNTGNNTSNYNPTPTPTNNSSKNPIIAGVLALIFIGLGHFYCGAYKKGFAIFILAAISFLMIASIKQFFFILAFIYFYQIRDAYKIANKT